MLKFLSSIGLAIFLIASIAGMAVIATIVGNDSVYTSIPFLGLIAAFGVNLFLCTLKLLPALKLTWQRDVGDLSDDAAAYNVYKTKDGSDALAVIRGILAAEKYKVTETATDKGVKLLAKKDKPSLLAPHLLHIAILIIMFGAMVVFLTTTSGGVWAFIDQKSPLTTSIRQAVGDGSAQRIEGEVGDDYIEVLDFQTVYDAEGHIENWITRFNLVIDNQQVVTGAETKVNHPYRYKNMLIYQNSYGNQYLVDLKGTAENNGAHSVPDGQHFLLDEVKREFMVMGLSDGQVLLKVFDLPDGDEEQEEIIHGQIVEFGDIVEITPEVTIEYLGANPYTILEVKVSRGSMVVMLGFIFAVIASILFWSGRYREIRVLANGGETVYLKIVCKNKVIVENIEEMLAQRLAKE